MQQHEYIPTDIVLVLFEYLNSRFIISKCRLVCNEWNTLIMNDIQWYDRANKLIQQQTKEQEEQSLFSLTNAIIKRGRRGKEPVAFPTFFSPVDKCVLLETEQNRCVLCCKYSQYTLGTNGFYYCRTCLEQQFKDTTTLRSNGVKQKVLNQLKGKFIQKQVYFRSLFFYLGEGDLEKGQIVYEKGIEHVTKRTERKFNKLRSSRIHWIRYLSDKLVADKSLTQEECEQLINNHCNDFNLSVDLILREYEKAFQLEDTIAKLESSYSSGNINRGVWLTRKETRRMNELKRKERIEPTKAKLIEYANSINNGTEEIENVEDAIPIIRSAFIIQRYKDAQQKEKDKTARIMKSKSSGSSSNECEKQKPDSKEALDDELQILSDGRYTLHEQLPKICAKRFSDLSSVKQIPNLIQCLDREVPLRDIIEDYGYNYDAVPIFYDINNYIVNGGNYRTSYEAAYFIVRNIDGMFSNTLGSASNIRIMQSLKQRELTVTAKINDEDAYVDWKCSRMIINQNATRIKESMQKDLLGKRSIHEIEQAQSRYKETSIDHPPKRQRRKYSVYN
jgi:hypothetical protein